MHANFVKFFQDTSKFQEMYRLCIFKKEFAKWIDRHSVFQLCSWKYGLQITWFSLPSFGDQSLDKKGLFYHTFHIHLSASLSNIIRSNYRIFKLKGLWVCVCVWGVCVCACVCVCSVMSNSLQFYGMYPTRLHCLWDFLGKNTGVGCHLDYLIPKFAVFAPVKTSSHFFIYGNHS